MNEVNGMKRSEWIAWPIINHNELNLILLSLSRIPNELFLNLLSIIMYKLTIKSALLIIGNIELIITD